MHKREHLNTSATTHNCCIVEEVEMLHHDGRNYLPWSVELNQDERDESDSA